MQAHTLPASAKPNQHLTPAVYAATDALTGPESPTVNKKAPFNTTRPQEEPIRP